MYKNNNLKLYLTKDNQKSWVVSIIRINFHFLAVCESTLSISLHIYHFLLIKISTFNDGRTPILKSLSCEVNGNQCPEECKWQKWDDLLGLWQIDGTMRASCAGISNDINHIVSKTISL